MSEGVDPHVVKLRDDAEGWRKMGKYHLTSEEPFLTGLSEQEAENLLRSNWALVPSTTDAAEKHRFGSEPAPFDPTTLTVGDLEAELADGDYAPEELFALADAENEADDPRTTALDAIEAAFPEGTGPEGGFGPDSTDEEG